MGYEKARTNEMWLEITTTESDIDLGIFDKSNGILDELGRRLPKFQVSYRRIGPYIVTSEGNEGLLIYRREARTEYHKNIDVPNFNTNHSEYTIRFKNQLMNLLIEGLVGIIQISKVAEEKKTPIPYDPNKFGLILGAIHKSELNIVNSILADIAKGAYGEDGSFRLQNPSNHYRADFKGTGDIDSLDQLLKNIKSIKSI